MFNLRLGRSIQSFDFTNTYSIVDFLSLSSNIRDIDDRTLNKSPLDGLSIALIDITKQIINQYIALHFYIDDIIDENK